MTAPYQCPFRLKVNGWVCLGAPEVHSVTLAVLAACPFRTTACAFRCPLTQDG